MTGMLPIGLAMISPSPRKRVGDADHAHVGAGHSVAAHRPTTFRYSA